MKKILKLLSGLLAVCITAGVILTVIGALLGGAEDFTFWWDRRDTEHQSSTGENKVFEESTDVKKVRLEISAGKLVVDQGDYSQVEIASEGILSDPDIKRSGDRLRISYTGKMLTGGSVYLHLPEDMILEELKIDAGAASVELGDLEVSKMEVDLGAGELKSSGQIRAEEFHCDIGMGSLSIEEADFMKTEIEVGMGEADVRMKGKESDYFFAGEVSMGDLTYGDQSWNMKDDITVGTKDAERKIDGECSMGRLKIDFSE